MAGQVSSTLPHHDCSLFYFSVRKESGLLPVEGRQFSFEKFSIFFQKEKRISNFSSHENNQREDEIRPTLPSFPKNACVSSLLSAKSLDAPPLCIRFALSLITVGINLKSEKATSEHGNFPKSKRPHPSAVLYTGAENEEPIRAVLKKRNSTADLIDPIECR